MRKDEEAQGWSVFESSPHRIEVVSRMYPLEVVLSDRPIGGYTWSVPIPTNEAFLFERVVIRGLASDLIEGTFTVDNRANGRRIIDSPLWWYAIRSKRRIYPPWLISEASILAVSIMWKNSAAAGLDMFNRPRRRRVVEVLIIGKGAIRL